MAVLLLLAILVMTISLWKKQHSQEECLESESAAMCLSWGMLAGVILTGVGVSILISPIFVYRYMIPFLGSFWFVFAVLLNQISKRLLKSLACILILAIGWINVKGVFWEEENKTGQIKATLQELDRIEKEDVLIFNFNHVQAVVGFYKDNESYLLYQEPEPLMKRLYPNLRILEEAGQIEELLNQQTEGSIWFLGSFNSREEVVEQLRQKGLSVTQEGSCLLERYWFNLYRIEKAP